MSIELKDFRGKITTETDVALEAMARITGKDRSEIAREILHKWSLEQVSVASMLDTLLRREGLAGIGGGK